MKLTQLRSLAILVIFILIHYSGTAQNVVMHAFFNGNTFYLGIANPLSIAVEGYSCASVVVKVKTGSVEKTSDCQFIYYGRELGVESIDVFVKKGTGLKKVDSRSFYVKKIPSPTSTVGGYNNADTIPMDAFKAQAGVGAYLNCCGFEIKFTVVHFHLFIIRNEQIIFNIEKQSNSFGSEEIMAAKKQLEPGDKILIFDIVGRGESGIDINLLPLQYVLK